MYIGKMNINGYFLHVKELIHLAIATTGIAGSFFYAAKQMTIKQVWCQTQHRQRAEATEARISKKLMAWESRIYDRLHTLEVRMKQFKGWTMTLSIYKTLWTRKDNNLKHLQNMIKQEKTITLSVYKTWWNKGWTITLSIYKTWWNKKGQ